MQQTDTISIHTIHPSPLPSCVAVRSESIQFTHPLSNLSLSVKPTDANSSFHVILDNSSLYDLEYMLAYYSIKQLANAIQAHGICA